MRKIKGYELRAGIEAMAHKVCSDLGLNAVNVCWRGIPTAAINDRGDMMLADIADDALVTQAQLKKYSGFVVHELLHRKFTDFRVGDYCTYISKLHNACEDAWIERKAIAGKLTGNVEALLTDLANGMVADSLKQSIDWSDPEAYPFALAIYARGFCKRTPVPAALVPIFDEATRRIDNCTNSNDTLAVARWVFDQINAAAQSPEEQKKPAQKPSQGSGEGTQGDEQGDGEGTPSDETPTDAGKTKGVGKDARAIEVEPNLDPIGDAGTGSYSKTYALADKQRHVGVTAQHKIKAMQSGKLRYEVRKLFENSALEEWQVNRKSGSLNSSALHSVAAGNVAVFKRHHEEAGIDSAVVIVLDVSSSMWAADNKGTLLINHSVNVCAALVDTLHRAGVAVSVITFGGRTSILKDWSMHPKKLNALLPLIMQGGDTNDYFAIRYAHEMLLARPEQRKVVFSITDGVGDALSTMKQVATGERIGITTVGVGIYHDVKSVYPNAVRVDNLDDMASASFKQIKVAA